MAHCTALVFKLRRLVMPRVLQCRSECDEDSEVTYDSGGQPILNFGDGHEEEVKREDSSSDPQVYKCP